MGLFILAAAGLSLFFAKNGTESFSTMVKPHKEERQSVALEVMSLDSFKEDSSVKSSKDQVANIRKVSAKALLSKAEKEELYNQLEDKGLQEKIRTKLSDAALMSNAHVKERLELLDVLYEGIKSQRIGLSEDYIEIASEILSVKNPFNQKTQKEEYTHFIGDRAELAFFVSKIDAEKYQDLKVSSLAKNEQANVYFKTTKKLSELYQVAL